MRDPVPVLFTILETCSVAVLDRPVMVMNAHCGRAHPGYDSTGVTAQFVPPWRPR